MTPLARRRCERRGRRRARADWGLVARHALAATLRRPGHSAMTATGVALGIGVFLVSVGWSQTVGSQINQTFDELAATLLSVRDTQADTARDEAIGDDVESRLARIGGVVAGGRVWEAGALPVARSSLVDPRRLPVLVADPGALVAAGAGIGSGRAYADADVELRQPIALLGPGAAHALGIDRVRPGLTIRIGSVPVSVIGVLSTTGSAPELDGAVIVPPHAPIAAGDTEPRPSHMTALVRVELGAAGQVAALLPPALRPDAPTRLGVLVPPEPRALHDDVSGSLNVLALGAAALSLLVGAMGIGNAMLIAVTQRAGEIGLRRAIGAGRRHVTAQFLLEGAVLGLVGGVAGLVAGEAVLLALALARGWSPVLDGRLLPAAPAVGLVTGVLASLVPAWRAAGVEPARSLRT